MQARGWYNNRITVIIQILQPFSRPLQGQPKTWPLYHFALLRGIIINKYQNTEWTALPGMRSGGADGSERYADPC